MLLFPAQDCVSGARDLRAGVVQTHNPRCHRQNPTGLPGCQYTCIDISKDLFYSAMMAKSDQLQIRVSREEKRLIAHAAARAGLDMSTYVLSRVISTPAAKFQSLTLDVAGPEPRYALAELNSSLNSFTSRQLRDAVSAPPSSNLTPYMENYVAAMVEQACAQRAVAIPQWTHSVKPLAEPVFASAIAGLRLYLLTHSPAPFRRRNIFIDSTVGDRV